MAIDEDPRRAVVVAEPAQQIEHLPAAAAVEVAGRLVGEDD
jgi:hypothetical protein